MFESLPVFAVCGYSGSGKTTLLEQVVPRFVRRGMRVAIVKHDVHGITSDVEGKDSERLFQAGADVVIHGPHESLQRCSHHEEHMILQEVERLTDRYDLVLLEGFKRLPCRKVWLLKDRETAAPDEVGPVEGLLAWDTDRISMLEMLLSRFLEGLIRRTPVSGCVLIGGRSERMGRAKHLLPHFEDAEQTWLHHAVTILQRHCEHVVLAGSGSVPEDLQNLPRLADPPDIRGPMAGLLAAMRWLPKANWLLAACDMPCLSDEAVQWILAQRRPSAWALLPQLTTTERVEPLFAWYGSRCRPAIEAIAASDCPAPKRLAQHLRAQVVAVPASIAGAWSDADTPEAALPFTNNPVTES